MKKHFLYLSCLAALSGSCVASSTPQKLAQIAKALGVLKVTADQLAYIQKHNLNKEEAINYINHANTATAMHIGGVNPEAIKKLEEELEQLKKEKNELERAIHTGGSAKTEGINEKNLLERRLKRQIKEVERLKNLYALDATEQNLLRQLEEEVKLLKNLLQSLQQEQVLKPPKPIPPSAPEVAGDTSVNPHAPPPPPGPPPLPGQSSVSNPSQKLIIFFRQQLDLIESNKRHKPNIEKFDLTTYKRWEDLRYLFKAFIDKKAKKLECFVLKSDKNFQEYREIFREIIKTLEKNPPAFEASLSKINLELANCQPGTIEPRFFEDLGFKSHLKVELTDTSKPSVTPSPEKVVTLNQLLLRSTFDALKKGLEINYPFGQNPTSPEDLTNKILSFLSKTNIKVYQAFRSPDYYQTIYENEFKKLTKRHETPLPDSSLIKTLEKLKDKNPELRRAQGGVISLLHFYISLLKSMEGVLDYSSDETELRKFTDYHLESLTKVENSFMSKKEKMKEKQQIEQEIAISRQKFEAKKRKADQTIEIIKEALKEAEEEFHALKAQWAPSAP